MSDMMTSGFLPLSQPTGQTPSQIAFAMYTFGDPAGSQVAPQAQASTSNAAVPYYASPFQGQDRITSPGFPSPDDPNFIYGGGDPRIAQNYIYSPISQMTGQPSSQVPYFNTGTGFPQTNAQTAMYQPNPYQAAGDLLSNLGRLVGLIPRGNNQANSAVGSLISSFAELFRSFGRALTPPNNGMQILNQQPQGQTDPMQQLAQLFGLGSPQNQANYNVPQNQLPYGYAQQPYGYAQQPQAQPNFLQQIFQQIGQTLGFGSPQQTLPTQSSAAVAPTSSMPCPTPGQTNAATTTPAASTGPLDRAGLTAAINQLLANYFPGMGTTTGATQTPPPGTLPTTPAPTQPAPSGIYEDLIKSMSDAFAAASAALTAFVAKKSQEGTKPIA